MWPFSGIYNIYKKTEAAVIVQNLLQMQTCALIGDLDPKITANELVSLAWELKPDIFGGRFGQRPHKITSASYALALGLDLYKYRTMNKVAILNSLGNIIREIGANGSLYPLNSLDIQLIEILSQRYKEVSLISHTAFGFPKDMFTGEGFSPKIHNTKDCETKQQKNLKNILIDLSHILKKQLIVTKKLDESIFLKGNYYLGYSYGFCDAGASHLIAKLPNEAFSSENDMLEFKCSMIEIMLNIIYEEPPGRVYEVCIEKNLRLENEFMGGFEDGVKVLHPTIAKYLKAKGL